MIERGKWTTNGLRSPHPVRMLCSGGLWKPSCRPRVQVGHELEEAAQLAGASAWRRFLKIIFPLTSSGFVSGFLLTFITTMRELSLIVLLVTPSTMVLATQTLAYKENGDDQLANAVIIILIVLVTVGNFAIGRFRGGSLKRGLGM